MSIAELDQDELQLAEALAQYSDILVAHGPESQEEQRFFRRHKEQLDFRELADEAKRLETESRRFAARPTASRSAPARSSSVSAAAVATVRPGARSPAAAPSTSSNGRSSSAASTVAIRAMFFGVAAIAIVAFVKPWKWFPAAESKFREIAASNPGPSYSDPGYTSYIGPSYSSYTGDTSYTGSSYSAGQDRVKTIAICQLLANLQPGSQLSPSVVEALRPEVRTLIETIKAEPADAYGTKRGAIIALASLGPEAQEAVPTLLDAATKGDSSIRGLAVLALQMIKPTDPEGAKLYAAAKAEYENEGGVITATAGHDQRLEASATSADVERAPAPAAAKSPNE